MSFYDYVYWRVTTEISVMYGSEKVKQYIVLFWITYTSVHKHIWWLPVYRVWWYTSIISAYIPDYQWLSEYCLSSHSAQSKQYRDRKKPEIGTMSYSYWMTWRVIYSAQYHSQHWTLHDFEQFGTLYIQYTISVTIVRRDRDSNPLPLSFEPTPDWMSHRGRLSAIRMV